MKINNSIKLFAVVLLTCFTLTANALEQEIPKPGTVIGKSNYKQYENLFPPEILLAFEDGWGGLIEPASVPVGERAYHLPKAFVAMSAENKGKYSLDKDGNLIGGWNRNGLPFPDLQRSDEDFLIKFMWNFSGKYYLDDKQYFPDTMSFVQRKGEPVRCNIVDTLQLNFTNRIVVPPTPIMKSQNNVAYAQLWQFKEPEAIKNMMTVGIRYMDLNKADETYIYLPNMRRVLRGDSGQRSVPMSGSLVALDDIGLFDGKTNEFTYKLVGEQKVLALTDASNKEPTKNCFDKQLPLTFRGILSPVDVYVIDIVAKDPLYPQSKKRIYVSKDSLTAYYAVAWDRSGNLWKAFMYACSPAPIPGDDPTVGDNEAFSIDLQFGMTNLIVMKRHYNTGGLTWDDVSPASLVKRAR
jgi:hypothetical protein